MPTSLRVDRRRFLRFVTAGAASVALPVTMLPESLYPATAFAADSAAKLPTAAEFIKGKDARLIVHSVKTGEIETPLKLLREHAVTPKQILFVRNNQKLEGTLTTDGSTQGDWKLDLSGLLETPRSITVDELSKLPQRDVELVLQCSGNSRTRFEKSVKAEGVPWQNGAMGNVVYRGVMLRDVVEKLGLKLKPTAKFVAVEGRDVPLMSDAPDFEHSVPLADALDRSMLALSMNGEPMPKVHGGPVRFVVAGYYATMNVKWVSKVRFEEAESTNHHHVDRYRTPLSPIKPGTPFKSTLANSEPNWNMRIKSVIFSPLESERVAAGDVKVTGVAWNDGQARIVAVEVSTDDGQTWRRAQVSYPSSPYAWHPWQITIGVKPGKTTIQSRAVDALGRSQPLDGAVAWTPAGYCWNGVDAVTIDV